MTTFEMAGLGRDWEHDNGTQPQGPWAAAWKAFCLLSPAIMDLVTELEDSEGHLLIARRVPKRDDGRHFEVLFERVYGNPKKWKKDFDVQAHRMAEITGRTGMASRTVFERYPHLLLTDDGESWGSTIHEVSVPDGAPNDEIEQIIVAFSGAAYPVNHMIAEMVGAACAGYWFIDMEREQDAAAS